MVQLATPQTDAQREVCLALMPSAHQETVYNSLFFFSSDMIFV